MAQQIGTVTWFNEDKGYGFIRPKNGDDLVVYSREINGDPASLYEGQQVSFSVTPHRKAPTAHNVTVLQ